MVSDNYPVGVSLAEVQPEEPSAEKAESSSVPQIMVNSNYKGSTSPPQIMVQSSFDGKGSAAPKSTNDDASLDFDPTQTKILTLSTVLNSADVLDRIEYVSTFIYIYPYQMPPNTYVSLEREYWRKFFTYQASRNDFYNRIDGKNAREVNKAIFGYIEDDLRRAFDDMKVKFKNVTTTVVTNDLDLGSVTRSYGSTLGSTVGASIPVAPATVNPSINASLTDSVQSNIKLLRQLDQRSAYISPDANFLRITQRGMVNANLAGRFNEKVQLHIPPAIDPLYEVKLTASTPASTSQSNDPPVTASKSFEVRRLSQPLYNQVKVLVVSVAVVRHPVKLRRSISDTFGLAQIDAADTDFIVGVPRPSVITLWNFARELNNICAKDLDPEFGLPANEQIYFDIPSLPLPPQPLYLANASEDQLLDFEGEIYTALKGARYESKENKKKPAQSKHLVNLQKAGDDFFIILTNSTDGRTLRLGLLDSANKLKAFGTNYFPSYGKN